MSGKLVSVYFSGENHKARTVAATFGIKLNLK